MVIDNYDLWEMHDREEAEWLESLPKCKCCGQPIQQEQAVCIEEGYYCEDCEDEAWEAIRREYLESIA